MRTAASSVCCEPTGEGASMLTLTWIKCGNQWCDFWRVDLQNVTAHGVYLIWRGGVAPRVVRVGQGEIAARITAHRNDEAIRTHIGGNSSGPVECWH